MAAASYKLQTIANGTALSPAYDFTVAKGQPVAIQMPAGWDAAALTFQVSHDGATYQNLYDSAGTEVSITAAAARFIAFSGTGISLDLFSGIRYVKIRSGTAGTPVNQTADRVMALVFVG